ncbi:MAG: malonyl CoA-acyl carrier protein transacylase, partial [Verrucomicrobiota bacterium]
QNIARAGFGKGFNPLTEQIVHRAQPYQAGRVVDLLADQMTHPVNWVGSMQYLLGQGVETFTETGPGNVLNGLLKKIRRG